MKKWVIKIVMFVITFTVVSWLLLYEKDLSVEQASEVLADEESKFVEIDGMQVHYKMEGNGPNTVLLIHGTGAMLQTWDGWVENLKNDYKLVRLDMPAFGLTGPRPDNDYSLQAYVEFLDRFVQSQGLNNFILVGNSLGGEIAWMYTAEHQEKVDQLVLIAPAGFHQQKREGSLAFTMAQWPVLSNLMEKLGTAFLVRKSLEDVYADDQKITDELVNVYLTATKRAGNRHALIKRLQHQKTDQTDLLRKIEVPVLLMWGDQDVLVPHTAAPAYQERLSNSELIMYNNMGHVPMEEIPEQSANDFRAFVSDTL